MSAHDGYLSEKLKQEFESQVAATVKYILLVTEDLAKKPPEEALEPVEFDRIRKALIRRVWNLAKEGVRYGAQSVQRN